MKKLYLLLLTGFSVVAADAQIQFGVKAGANFSTFTGKDLGDVKMKAGFHGGAFVAVPLFNEFSLQPEVVYSNQGAKQSDGGATLNNGYLNVPVLFKYNNPSGFFAETGPQIGFLLNAKIKAQGVNQDMKPYFNTTDFSWALGMGYLLNDLNLGFDARYNLGLSNIWKQNSEGSLKNSVIQVSVFYLFGEKSGDR